MDRVSARCTSFQEIYFVSNRMARTRRRHRHLHAISRKVSSRTGGRELSDVATGFQSHEWPIKAHSAINPARETSFQRDFKSRTLNHQAENEKKSRPTRWSLIEFSAKRDVFDAEFGGKSLGEQEKEEKLFRHALYILKPPMW